MNRSRLTLTILTLTLFCSLTLVATRAYAGPCSGIRCNNTRVGRLFLSGDGNVYVRPADGGQANLSCGSGSANASSTYLTLKRSHKSFNEIYATLLAVKVAGSTVNFRLVTTSPACEIMYITVDRP